MEYLFSAPRRASSTVFRVCSARLGSQAAPTWEEQEVSAREPDDSRTPRLSPPAQPDLPPEAGKRREAVLRAVLHWRPERLKLALRVCRPRGAPELGGSASPRAALQALLRSRRWRRGQPRCPSHAPFLEKKEAESGWPRSRCPALLSPTFPDWRPTGPALPRTGSLLLSCPPPNFSKLHRLRYSSLCPFLLLSAFL